MGDKRFDDLVSHLMRFGRTREDAQDIAQEASMRVLQKNPGASWAYLLAAANNIAHNEYRRETTLRRGGGVQTLPLDDAMPDRRDLEREVITRIDTERLRRQLAGVMNELPRDAQLAILLRSRGYKPQEIATKLGLTYTNVRTKLSRATALLRKRLGRSQS